ncbi:MAG: transporter, family, macrolide efflux protein [Acidobacteriota bacterium]|jgi:MFS family permease|nr:transporter, family, macrolide efflux protein [Acidobacteriota bacterium]
MQQPAKPTILAEPAARLWNRDFALLWQGQMVSQLGNQAFHIAMMSWLLRATGSASLMGLLMFTALLPGVVLGPVGGTFADRHSRIRIALICDLLAGAGVLALSFMMFDPRVERLEPAAVRFVIALMFGVSALLGILRAFFTPALSAAIPDLVPRERIPAANSLNQISVQGSSLLGQAVGGVLFQALGAAFLYLVNGLSFLYAALCALLIRLPPRAIVPRPETAHPFRQFFGETAEGFRYLWKHTGLRDFTVIASVVNFLGMPIMVLFPFFVELYLKKDARWYGFLLAAIGAGSVAGFVLAGAKPLKGGERRRWIVTAMILAPLLFGILGVVSNAWAALGVAFLGGVALGVINVYLMSMVQMATPGEMRGRVLSVIMTMTGGLMPIGMVLGGIVGDLTGKNVPLIYAVCGGLGFLVASGVFVRRDLREFLAHG